MKDVTLICVFLFLQFYIGEGMDPEAAIMLLNYREDGVTPFFTVFKRAVKSTKVVSATLHRLSLACEYVC